MKKFCFCLFVLFYFLSHSCAQPIGPKISNSDKNWQPGGIFYGKSPGQEILSARTEYTKKFDRGNGLIDIYFGGPFHYADKNGILQDINLDIKTLYQAAFNYYNEENNFISRFGEIDARGVQMEYKNKMIAFGLMTKVSSGAWNPSPFVSTNTVVKNNSILYQNVYNNIDIGYEVTTEAVKHQMIFRNKEVFAGVPLTQQYVNVEELIHLPVNSILSDKDGAITGNKVINGNLFVSVNGEIIFTIKKSYIWDDTFKGNPNEQGQSTNELENFKAIQTSIVILSESMVRIVAAVPVSWLRSPNRVFPVVLDPTVNIGNAGSFNASYRYPFNTCRQQRLSQILFRKSDINAGGITTTGTITDIAFFQNTAAPIANNNVQIKMQEVSWNEMTTPTPTSSGFTNVFGPSTQSFTSGSNQWRTLNLSTPFTFTNTNNLLIEARFSNSTFTSGCNCDNTAPGGYWGWYNSPYAGHRWAYSTGAAPPPSGNTCNYNNSPEGNPAYGYFIPATRITINTTGGCVPVTFTNHPSSQTVVAPAQAQFTVAVSGTTPTYQWEMSTNGGASWSNVPAAAPYSGVTSNQLTINPTSAPLSNNRYRCRATNSCTTPTPATSNTAVLTINAAGCGTVVTPASSPSIPAAGGAGSFTINVTPNTCSWSASETLTWVTITSPLSGTGDGTLTYTVAANTGGPRNGTISVNGQNHTINQLGAAAPTTYTISGRVVENSSTGLPNVVISTTPAQGTATTDAQGYYTLNVPLTYSGIVRATLAPYTFAPPTQPVSSASYTNKDFDADAVSIKIQSNSVIPPWQREGDDYGFSIKVSMGTTTTSWHIQVDFYDVNNVLTRIPFPSTTSLSDTLNTLWAIPSQCQTLKNLSKLGSRVEYIAVYDPNPSITDTIKFTDIIEKKIDKETIVFHNPNGNIDFRLKYVPNTTGVKLSFSRVPKTSTATDNIISAVSSTQPGLNRHYILNIFSPGSNLADVKPGEFNYTIEYLGTSQSETGVFSLTKIGIVKTNGNTKVMIMINGYNNDAEWNAKTIRTLPPNTNWDSSDVSFSIIPYLHGFGIDAWYIGQPNTNSVKRNAFDIAKALEKIISLTPGTNEYFIICHSKGGLDTRALLGSTNSNASKLNKSLDGTSYVYSGSQLDGKISKVVFLATPHKGALVAYLGNTPGANDLQSNSDIIKELKKTNMPLNVLFANLTGITWSKTGDGVVSVNSSEFPFLGNGRTAVQMYQYDYNGDNAGLEGFHIKVHRTKNLSNYLNWTCNEVLRNRQKIKRFLLDGFLVACQVNTFNYYSFQASGSKLPGAKIITAFPPDSLNFLFGTTDEVGYINVLGLKTNYWGNNFDIIAAGYDKQRITIDSPFINSNKLSIALIKDNFGTNLIKYPQLSLTNQNPILSLPTIQIKVTSQNAFSYLINRQGSDSLFIPLILNNSLAAVPLDTGYNKIIVKFCGIDTAVQMKDVYYLPDTLMAHYAMDCSVNVPPSLSNSKMFVNSEFYKDITGSNTFKILQGTNEIKFSKYGYRDTTFVVDTVTTINLSMQPYSYSSLTDSTIFNFNNRPNPQYWKTITVKNLSPFSNVQLAAKQYDDPFTGMSLKPQTRKFAFRRIGSVNAAYYKTAIALDQINTRDKDSVYLLSIKGNRYIKYLPNQAGITEYDPEVQKVEFDKLDFTSNSTHEIVLMQNQAPLMKPMDTLWHSGQTLAFPISMFVTDPDSIKNDIIASSTDVKVSVSGNIVYVTAPVNFTGTTTFSVTGTHDWLDNTRTYTMKVIPPEVFIPTAFTPNNDGMNDILRPVFMGKLLYCHFSVFNRGGQKVFETKDCLAGWNGRIQGAEQSIGTFVYYLVYRFEGIKEEEKTAKGTFTLIR